MQLGSMNEQYMHMHITLTLLLHTLTYSFILETLIVMENHILEDINKERGMENESMSGQTEAERLYTELMERKKEQPSTMIKMEMNKTDFTRMVS